MDKQKLAELHNLIDEWASGIPDIIFSTPVVDSTPEEPKRELPKDKRVIRTKNTGDRVYLIDELAKTKAWVTSAEILEKLGFTMADVEEVSDENLVGYAMTASVYRVED